MRKPEEPTKRVGVFEAMNRIRFINRNIMSVVRFYSGPVKFTLGGLDRMDQTIRQSLTPRDAYEARRGDKPPRYEA